MLNSIFYSSHPGKRTEKPEQKRHYNSVPHCGHAE